MKNKQPPNWTILAALINRLAKKGVREITLDALDSFDKAAIPRSQINNAKVALLVSLSVDLLNGVAIFLRPKKKGPVPVTQEELLFASLFCQGVWQGQAAKPFAAAKAMMEALGHEVPELEYEVEE